MPLIGQLKSERPSCDFATGCYFLAEPRQKNLWIVFSQQSGTMSDDSEVTWSLSLVERNC